MRCLPFQGLPRAQADTLRADFLARVDSLFPVRRRRVKALKGGLPEKPGKPT